MFKTLLAGLLLVATTALANPLLDPAFWATASPESLHAAVRGGAEVNARDVFGATPLHWAAQFSETSEVVLVLLELGADHRARGVLWFSAWDLIQDNAALKNTPAYWQLAPEPGRPAAGTRQNPVPVGVTASVGPNWNITVIEVIPNAWDIIRAENRFNDPPTQGRQFIMARVRVSYVGPESGTPWASLTIRYVGSDGNTYGWRLGRSRRRHS